MSASDELAAALEDGFEAAWRDGDARLQHRWVALAHPDGRYVFNAAWDEGGGMVVRDHVIYFDDADARVADFLFAEDALDDPTMLAPLQAAAETVVRVAYVDRGFVPVTSTDPVLGLTRVELVGRPSKVHLRAERDGVWFGGGLMVPRSYDSQGQACPIGGVRGWTAVEGGVVVSLGVPTTIVDPEAGPARRCAVVHTAARLELIGPSVTLVHRGFRVPLPPEPTGPLQPAP